MKIIKDLKINDASYKFLDEDDKKLCGLSRVNIFVGKNNSGKSRFLRSIFYNNDNLKLEFVPDDNKFNEYLTRLYMLEHDLNSQKDRHGSSRDFNTKYKKIKECMNLNEYVIESESHCKSLNELYINYRIRPRDNSYLVDTFNKYFDDSKIFLDNNLFQYDFYKVYIPSLRGLLPFIPEQQINDSNGDWYSIYDYVEEDVFAQRVKLDYFGENANIITDIKDSFYRMNSNNSIITGHYFYKYVQEFLLGDLEQREIIKNYQEYLSNNFFQGEDVALIPKLDDDVLTIKIGNEKEQKIYNLGDGIQSIILITLPLFLYLNKANEINTNILVFIEEPEHGLHPSLQRKLLETFLDDRFENYQFFFTTHSNHFIDRTFEDKDISIYSFDKYVDSDENSNLNFNIEKVSFKHLPTLQKLGALPSSVLMSNCTILVEGPTDINHFDLYLKLFMDQLPENKYRFKRDIDYSFLIAGGDAYRRTLKDLNEIEKQRIFFISDYDDEKKNQSKLKLFEECRYTNFYILDVLEVENLISKDILLKILENSKFFKNFEINSEFEWEDYTKSNFYDFIKDNIVIGEKDDGFISDKKMKKLLSDKENEYVDSYDDLSNEAKQSAEKIYEFIEFNNPK